MEAINYEIEAVLGKGAFGTVYRAKDKRTGRVVAIKAVKNHDPTTTDHEVSVLRRIRHKQIIEYIESFYSREGHLCIVMDFADKGTLDNVRPEKAFLTKLWEQLFGTAQDWIEEVNVWRFLEQIADALNYLHTSRPVHILHRDLKPANILCKSAGSEGEDRNEYAWKIADFGIARLLNKDAEGNYYASTRIGTPIYMAPEVSIQRPWAS